MTRDGGSQEFRVRGRKGDICPNKFFSRSLLLLTVATVFKVTARNSTEQSGELCRCLHLYEYEVGNVINRWDVDTVTCVGHTM